jgi:hypothetical protein
LARSGFEPPVIFRARFGPPYSPNGGSSLGKTTIPAGFREFDERQNLKIILIFRLSAFLWRRSALIEQGEASLHFCQQ